MKSSLRLPARVRGGEVCVQYVCVCDKVDKEVGGACRKLRGSEWGVRAFWVSC